MFLIRLVGFSYGIRWKLFSFEKSLMVNGLAWNFSFENGLDMSLFVMLWGIKSGNSCGMSLSNFKHIKGMLYYSH